MLLSDLMAFLNAFAPPALAESWDNVGLLVGDPGGEISRVMACLTVTGDTAREAIEREAELIIAHHPLPFRPLSRITTQSPEGRLLWDLIRAGVAVYSPHTAFDSAAAGINQMLAEGLGLTEIGPLVSNELAGGGLGSGRHGTLQAPLSLAHLAERVKTFLKLSQVQIVGDSARPLTRIAVACGSAGEFVPTAAALNCDVLLTGETRYHTCLEAQARELALMLVGHYASERFGVERLAEVLTGQFPALTVWASARERDPLSWVG